ncbi:MAG: low molecular weight protein-tyrosine-phosphatase [Pseudomonadota bacterium]
MNPNPFAKTSVLFVCMGNICRSPTAEATFRHHVEAAGLADAFIIESAGTHAYHVGHPPDERAAAVALEYEVSMDGMAARQVSAEDFLTFDHIIAMDSDNMARLTKLRPDDAVAKLSLLLSHDPDALDEEVPDPYYGSDKGFELVFDWVNQATAVLARKLSPADD